MVPTGKILRLLLRCMSKRRWNQPLVLRFKGEARLHVSAVTTEAHVVTLLSIKIRSSHEWMIERQTLKEG